MRQETTLPRRARKLLSFTDNRQDASLQAGHFNDFVEVGLLRSALLLAAQSAACYDCLMSYSNQRDQNLLDRQTIRDLLQQLASAQVVTAPDQLPRPEHLRQLMRLAGSQLEVRWLQWMEDLDLRLPTAAQALVEACHTRPDSLYENHQAAIYVDGPPHDFPELQARDLAVHEAMEDYGYTVIRFAHDGDWMEKVRAYPHVFGTPAPQRRAPAAVGEEVPGLDLDLFPQAWHAVLAALATDQAVTVEPGGDVTQGGRVVGQYVAELAASGTTTTLVDARADNVTAILAALQAQGRTALAGDPTAADILSQIIHQLEHLPPHRGN